MKYQKNQNDQTFKNVTEIQTNQVKHKAIIICKIETLKEKMKKDQRYLIKSNQIQSNP